VLRRENINYPTEQEQYRYARPPSLPPSSLPPSFFSPEQAHIFLPIGTQSQIPPRQKQKVLHFFMFSTFFPSDFSSSELVFFLPFLNTYFNNPKYHSPLTVLCGRADVTEEQVKQALYLGAHKFHRDEDGCTALHWAAMKGVVAAATVLTSGSNRDVEVIPSFLPPSPPSLPPSLHSFLSRGGTFCFQISFLRSLSLQQNVRYLIRGSFTRLPTLSFDTYTHTYMYRNSGA